jgi:hypothetical protein
MAKTSISEPTNGALATIETEIPYIAHIKIVGTADLLLHAWSCESVEAKGKAKKGSEAKKSVVGIGDLRRLRNALRKRQG